MSSLLKGLLAVLVVAVLIFAGYAFLQKDSSPSSDLVQSDLLGAIAGIDWLVGDTLKTSEEITVRGSASLTGEDLGTQPLGATGVIEQGPVSADGFDWWRINYTSGVDGWTTGAYHYEVGVGAPSGQFDYSVTAPDNITVTVGKSAIKSKITLTKVSGTAVPVSFSTISLPVGVRASFLPSRCTPTTACSSVMTLTPSSSALATTTTFMLRTMVGTSVKERPINLTVVRAPAKPTTPVLSSPLNGAVSVAPDSNLTWQASVGATTYNLQLATNSSFTGSQIFRDITTTTYAPTLAANTKYYWRVQGVNTLGLSAWSSARSFTTTVATTPVPDPIPDPDPIPTPIPTTGIYKLGDRIRVTGDDLNIRSAALIDPSTLLGQQDAGAIGTVVDGPQNAGGLVWWKINYDAGVDGWNTQNYITLSDTSAPLPPVLNFNLTDPSGVSLEQGTTASVPVRVNITESTAVQNVGLGIAGLPAGVSGSFNPVTCTSLVNGASTCDVSLGVASLGSATPGSYTATITATGAGKSDTTTLSVTITATPPVVIPGPDPIPTTGKFKLGEKVQVTQGPLNIRSSSLIDPSSLLGTQPTASQGSVEAGPAVGSGNNLTWWKINYDSGVDGWNTENYITWAGGTAPTPIPNPDPIPDPIPNPIPTPVYSNTFNAGQTVEVYNAGTLNVRSGPGTTYPVLGTKIDGATGVVQNDTNAGLQTADGNYWWKVDFNGLVGWGVEAFLRLFQNIPVPDPIPQPSAGGGVSVGFNTDMPWDVARDQMFADLIYSGRPFEVSSVDSNGWPQADFKIMVASEGGEVQYGADSIDLTGTFTLAFNGQATVGVVGGAMSCPSGKTCDAGYNGGRMYYNSAINQSVAEVTFTKSQDTTWSYGFNFSNTKRTASSGANTGVTNVRVIRPGHVTVSGGEYKASQKFSKAFLASIEPFEAIRTMNYQYTNLVWPEGNTDQRLATLGADGKMGWSERPMVNKRRTIDSPFGGPIEHMVDLANETGIDLWISIPHRAIDDMSADSYVYNLALYLKNNLDADSNVYLEWSNEVWNCGQFRQCTDNSTWAGAAGLKPRWHTMKKIVEVSNIFRTVFGDAAMPGSSSNPRIRPVYADQFANVGEVADVLAWGYRTYPQKLNHYLYGLALAPYYGSDGTGDTGTATQILGGVVNAINGRMNAIMNAGGRGGTYIDFYSMAQSHSLKLLAYEGGTDFGYTTTNGLTKIALQYNAGMKDRTLGYLGQWSACGGELFTYYRYSFWTGSKHQWGLTDNPSASISRQPKLAGAQQAANTDKRYFECAPITTNFFSYNPNGVIGTGYGLTGTYYSDNNLTTVAKLKDNSSVVRIDPLINFIWNNYGVSDAYPRTDYTGAVHTFSAKWTGQIQPKFTGAYKFEMELDTGDTATVKVNGQTLTSSQTINLTAGTKYSIEVTYQPNGNGGIARLWWSSTGGSNGNQIRAIVPRSQLYPN
ncbi:MAG: hypothetical protein KBC48_01910 [Candidatus Pacebacteria bacterium]|nr:hypothetical protein [Candidatus Paceibacterota bacterium]